MKLVITGAGGYIGKELVNQAISFGHELVLISRKTRADLIHLPGVQCIEKDLTSDPLSPDDIAGVDVLIHLFAMMTGPLARQHEATMTSTAKILQVATQTNLRRLILVSSIAVIDYESMSENSVIDETVRLNERGREMGDYALTKRDQENQVHDWSRANLQCDTIILRPGLVYSDGQLSLAHAGFIKKGIGLVAHHEGRVPLIKLQRCVQGILAACETTVRSPEVINLVDEKCPNQQQYLAQLKQLGMLRVYASLSWKTYFRVGRFLALIFGLLGLESRLPDAFRSSSMHARVKPLQFSNLKANRLLNL